MISFKKIQLSFYGQYKRRYEDEFLAALQTKTTISVAALLALATIYYYFSKFGFVPLLILPKSKMIIGLVICMPVLIFVHLITLSTKELEEGMNTLTEQDEDRNRLFFNVITVLLGMILMFSLKKFGGLQ
jgi:hypothetical protein